MARTPKAAPSVVLAELAELVSDAELVELVELVEVDKNLVSISAGLDALEVLHDKVEADVMTLIYGNADQLGLIVSAAAWKSATKDKLTKLGTPKSPKGSAESRRYFKLSELNRVIERFGVVKPARLTSWTVILQACSSKLTDAQLDAIEGPITDAAIKTAKGATVVAQTISAVVPDAVATPIDWNSLDVQQALCADLNAFAIAMRSPKISVHPDVAAALKNAVKLVADAIK